MQLKRGCIGIIDQRVPPIKRGEKRRGAAFVEVGDKEGGSEAKWVLREITKIDRPVVR